MPNLDQILSLVRAILVILGSVLVTKGFPQSNWEAIAGVVVMLVPVVWSMFVHTDAQKLKAVEKLPDVAKIVPVSIPDPNSAVAAAVEDPARVKVAAPSVP